MEIRAYDESYLPYVMANLGEMFDIGVNYYGFSEDLFYARFLASGVAHQIEIANPNFLCGHSGFELAEIVIEESGGGLFPQVEYAFTLEKSPEYWAGWVLAQYQWRSCRSFSEISVNGLPFSKIVSMYHPLHEADPRMFFEAAEEIIGDNSRKVNLLKNARLRIGLSQKALAELSGVSLRMIRAYEQKTQDLSKAEYATVVRLSRVLKIPAGSLGRISLNNQ